MSRRRGDAVVPGPEDSPVLVLVDRETTDEELEQMLDRDRLAIFMSHVSTDEATPPAVLRPRPRR